MDISNVIPHNQWIVLMDISNGPFYPGTSPVLMRHVGAKAGVDHGDVQQPAGAIKPGHQRSILRPETWLPPIKLVIWRFILLFHPHYMFFSQISPDWFNGKLQLECPISMENRWFPVQIPNH